MALKPQRHVNPHGEDISFFMNETATRGGMTWFLTGGSGAALDQALAVVTYDAINIGVSGASAAVPAGLLLNDMVNIDQTRQRININKDEMQVGGKVRLMRYGWVVTNMISSGTPAAGNKAYADRHATSSGVNLTSIAHVGGVDNRPLVGQWLSAPDEDGYAKVFINLTGSNSPQF